MIVFHAGLAKTGSTAIQRVLFYNQFPKIHYRKEGYRELDSEVNGDEPWVDDVNGLVRSGMSVVLSNERLLGNSRNVYQEAPQRISSINKVFGDVGYRAVIYLRPQLDWLESMYVQAIHEGQWVRPKEFCDAMIECEFLAWEKLMLATAENSRPGSLIFLPYSKDRVIDSFLSLVTGQQVRVKNHEKVLANVSETPERTKILRALNELTDERYQRRIRELLQFKVPQLPVSSRKSLFPESLQLALIENFRNSWSTTCKLLSDPVFNPEGYLWAPKGSHLDCVDRPIEFVGHDLSDEATINELLNLVNSLCIQGKFD